MQPCTAGQRVDFRKGHDGLATMAHAELGFAPKAGGWWCSARSVATGSRFCFGTTAGSFLSAMQASPAGQRMIYKRLEQGGFAWAKGRRRGHAAVASA
ncbi:IS66 family insertion sequence element accessory protein TnpB, partial [Phaeovulum sp.]|uniref:IS66 family insertion sequence element accessory protein TnpB n=1 Tax=Phaeovulum sp. TaxID=2934796 RepID=UPI0039E326AF